MTAALPSPPSSTTSPHRIPADWRRIVRGILLVALATTILGWLFLEADSVDIQEHQNYSRDLGRLHQGDAEFNVAILVSHFGLHRDFDGITASVANIQHIVQALETAPSFLAAEDQAKLQEALSEFRHQQDAKVEAVDHYKREISVLRNSLAYFPAATNIFLENTPPHSEQSLAVGMFSRDIATYALNGDIALGTDLVDRAHALRQMPTPNPLAATRLDNLLLHANIILEHKPVLDTLTRGILEFPTAKLSNQLTQLYADGYQRAAQRSHIYRVLLFVTALGLAAYLALAFVRLGRTSHALSRANRHLEERIDTLHRTQEELRLYATVFTNAAEGMAITDAASRIIAINPAFTRITGYAPGDIVGQRPSKLNSGRQDREFYREMWQTLASRGQWQGEIWNQRHDGTAFPEWLSITAVRDTKGVTTHYIGIFSDMTERKEAEARIHHLSHHDALTSLPNRLLLQGRLNRAILQARNRDRHVAVLLLDLDRFKTINETLGHEAGDALLVQVTQRCLGAVRDTDTVARQGGDEFVILLPELAHAQDAAQVARKILSALTQPFQLGPHALTVTGSIGIALYPGDGQNDSALLRNADTAMYRAKGEGRNCFQFYSPDMNTTALGELLLENQLRSALNHNELLLHYQPKIHAGNNQLAGAEALLRWQHPQLGFLAPGRFIPAAEESGLIVPIGEWVIRETCRQLREWIDAGLTPVPVAVNLSAQQFIHQDVISLVRSALADNDLPAHLLGLELTETTLMRDIDRTIDTLTELRDMGISLSIDDFGSGYSSLTYLRRFQVNVLKIDRSFVHDIRPDGEEGHIVAAVIVLAHSLGQQVVAEGVETEFQRDFLLRHGCDQFQGFLFSKPEPVADFSQRLMPS